MRRKNCLNTATTVIAREPLPKHPPQFSSLSLDFYYVLLDISSLTYLLYKLLCLASVVDGALVLGGPNWLILLHRCPSCSRAHPSLSQVYLADPTWSVPFSGLLQVRIGLGHQVCLQIFPDLLHLPPVLSLLCMECKQVRIFRHKWAYIDVYYTSRVCPYALIKSGSQH